MDINEKIKEFDLWLENYGCNFADRGESLTDSHIRLAINLYSELETDNYIDKINLRDSLESKYFPSIWQQLAMEMFEGGEINLCDTLPFDDDELPF